MQIASLPSPAILIEKSRLDANIKRMQAKADSNNVSLRPHTKTHKSVTIARQQIDAGAHGLTVAKQEKQRYMHHRALRIYASRMN